MLRHERSAPIWLFSFVDLAFLLLIAFTQISPIESSPVPGLAQLEIPQIESPAELITRSDTARHWQLRVLPPQPGDASSGSAIAAAPFELISPEALARRSAGEAGLPATRIDSTRLASALEGLFAESGSRPVLTPHPDARAEDLLVAVGLLADVWHGDRQTAVRPRPAVAAGPRVDAATR